MATTTPIAEIILAKAALDPWGMRDQHLESWLEERGGVWKGPELLPLSQVHTPKTRVNPARGMLALDPSHLARLAQAVEAETVLPSLWTYFDYGGRRVIFDGYHRFDVLKDKGFSQYYLYTILNDDLGLIESLASAINGTHGLMMPFPGLMEKAMDAAVGRQGEVSQIAFRFQINASTLRDNIKRRALLDQLSLHGFDEDEIRPRLNEFMTVNVHDRVIFNAIVRLFLKVERTDDRMRTDLNRQIKECDGEAAKLSLLIEIENSPRYQELIKKKRNARRSDPTGKGTKNGQSSGGTTTGRTSGRASPKGPREMAFLSLENYHRRILDAPTLDDLIWAKSLHPDGVRFIDEANRKAAALFRAAGVPLPKTLRNIE